MRTTQRGVNLIKSFEGFRSQAYPDPVGIWTIGYGFTTGVKAGDTITEEQAELRLRAELIHYENCIERVLLQPVTDYQFDALVSLCYNIGCGAFKMSALLHLLNQGKMQEAADHFLDWVYAGKVILPGLIRRRVKERDLFRGMDWLSVN